jgi:hypothetical protein
VVAGAGLDSIRPFLTEVILGRDPDLARYVGCIPRNILPEPSTTSLHQVGTDLMDIDGTRVIFAQIRLFSYFRPLTPVYTVLVGEFLA